MKSGHYWAMYQCQNMECDNSGCDLRVDSGIEFPTCIVCGKLLSVADGDLTPTMKAIEDAPDPEPKDRILIGPITSPWPEQGNGEDADPDWPEDIWEDEGYEDDVNEWMRMRDGIDKAEIALKGFCNEMGAHDIEGRITGLCAELQDLVYNYCGLGD